MGDENARCDSCGTALSAESARGLCPACLIRLAVEESGPADRPTSGPTSLERDPEGELTGRRIGPYRLLERLGQGGMGEVYLAEQRKPLRRRVALKVIKRGMDTREVIARFETERQALALMDHPSIARVLDAGETPGGRPYFVMEYVRGVPITEHCDRERLTVPERLELFQQVCEGVQHAHQKAVIHRDLKPSNVLVTVQDDRAVPKIIDFGLAKALQRRLTDKSLYTQLGEFIGTPEYMSPEQADPSAPDVDTRTDVYSLGVLLYELLAGVLPFDSKRLREAGLAEIQRWIREEEPSSPSARLESLGEGSAVSASARREQVRTLVKRLRGDLDWITLRALDKERSRRYGSAAELAADLGRYLSNEAVVACPPSRAYLLRKFVRRNRVPVAVAATAFLALGVFSTVISMQARRVEAEKERAQREADKSQAINEFMNRFVRLADPDELGPDATLREALDRLVSEIEGAFPDDPEIEAQLFMNFGVSYRWIGDLERARGLFARALAIRREVLGESDESTLWSMLYLTISGGSASKEEHEAQLWDIVARGGSSTVAFNAMSNLAGIVRSRGALEEAETLYRRLLDDWPGGHGNPVFTTRTLARLRSDRGDDEGARAIMRNSVLPMTRELYTENHHAGAAQLMRNAQAQLIFGEPCETVLPVLGEAESLFQEVLGDAMSQPRALALVEQASCLADTGGLAEAEGLLVELLRLHERDIPEDSLSRERALRVLASIYSATGRTKNAEETLPGTTYSGASAHVSAALPPVAVAGRPVTVSVLMRTEPIGPAYLWIRVEPGEAGESAPLTARTGPFPGPRGWARYEVSLEVPEQVSRVTFGVTVEGYTRIQVDAFDLEVDGVRVELTDAFDLGFEEEQLRGLDTRSEEGEFNFQLVRFPPTPSGGQSLRIWPTEYTGY